MGSGPAERFWDERAREDAFFFVDNRLQFGATDLERFWKDGERDLTQILDLVGVTLSGEEAVLDIGCGVGRLTRALASRVRTVHGIDISQEMLALAREHNVQLRNVTWVHGDGQSLQPLPDGAFDACISHVVFQHIPDPQITLNYVREIGRVLRPGGWAIFQISNDPAVHRPGAGAARVVRGLLSTLRVGPRGQSDPAWLGSAVEIPEVEAAAEDGGMAIEQVANPGTQFCMVLVRRLG